MAARPLFQHAGRKTWLARRRRHRDAGAALPKPQSPCKRSPHRCRPRPAARKAAGPVAQWLEPAAHNGLVAGSSPARPTNEINDLRSS
ncbi:hypothetical protein ABIF21_007160 [Bradyrhizobium elkanii]